jgi:FAD/FMN-containing dehydrogenase
MPETVVPGLERRLKAQLLGDVQFDAFTRGRYATDASHYQIMPIGVVAPSSTKEVEYTLALAREEGVSVTARGGGTSQSGQTVNSTLIVDCSKYLDRVLERALCADLGETLDYCGLIPAAATALATRSASSLRIRAK